MMDEPRNIEIDFDAVLRELSLVLDELDALGKDRTLTTVIGPEAAGSLREQRSKVAASMEDTFRLVVAGDFKRGKSTLVNALVGKDVAPMAVTPETVTFNEMGYGETERVTAVLRNRRRATLAFEELPRERLEALVAELPGELDHIEIELPDERLKGLTIIDTPGLSDVMANFDERVAATIASADAIVFVVSCLSPLSLSERDFLASAVLPQSFSRVLVALNMADALESATDEERVVQMMRERVSVVSDKLYVYPVSALDELCRTTGKRRPEPERADELAADFDRFREALREDILFKRDVIKAERSRALVSGLLDAWEGQLGLCRSVLGEGRDELAAREARLAEARDEVAREMEERERELADDIELMRAETQGWMADYLSRLRDEIASLPEDLKTREIQRHLQFYVTDKVREGIDACVSVHSGLIGERCARYTNEMAEGLFGAALGSVGSAVSKNLGDIGWSTSVKFSFALDRLSGELSLGPLVLVGQAVAGFFRERELDRSRRDFVRPLLESFGDVQRSVAENVDRIYGALAEVAVTQLREGYLQEVERTEAAVRSAREALEDTSVETEGLTATLEEALRVVAGLKERVEGCS